MPPKKRTYFDEKETESDDGEVSNKDLLNAIATSSSDLSKRMGEFENNMLKLVDEKMVGMEKNIMDQVNAYQQRSDEKVCKIEKRMDEIVNQVHIDMNAAIDEKLSGFEQKIKGMVTSTLSNASSGIAENRIDQLERQVRMNELVISGVPTTDNEKLMEIIASICRVIQFHGGSEAIETCFRLPIHNNRRRSSPSIIVKFWGADGKNDFFKRYFATKKLCTSMIGYSAPSRIYVNENLTKKNFDIFCKARDLKKEGKIIRFNTQRGRVTVKLQGSEKSHTVDSMDKLSLLVSQHATATPMNH